MKALPKRDEELVHEYVKDKRGVNELARIYGISARRVAQILDEQEVVRRKRTNNQRTPLSGAHEKIGLALYNHRHNLGLDCQETAQDLGWSVIKLRRVEQGRGQLELLDLMDVSAYTEIDIPRLIGEKRG